LCRRRHNHDYADLGWEGLWGSGDAAGTTSEDQARIKALTQENKELRRANEILRRASAFFA